jgi:hypothetical protein
MPKSADRPDELDELSLDIDENWLLDDELEDDSELAEL